MATELLNRRVNPLVLVQHPGELASERIGHRQGGGGLIVRDARPGSQACQEPQRGQRDLLLAHEVRVQDPGERLRGGADPPRGRRRLDQGGVDRLVLGSDGGRDLELNLRHRPLSA